MPATLTVRDETLDGRSAREWPLDVPAERLSVRELIRSRVVQEVRDHNDRRVHRRRGLIRPPAEDRSGRSDRGPRACEPVDWRTQYDLAVEAFAAGRLLILIGDAQADDLDEEFAVRPGTAVTFLRLTLSVGG